MPIFDLTTNDGKGYSVEAETPELARKAFDSMMAAQKGPTIASPTSDQGSILPFRRSPEGPVFDPQAGVLGSLLRAVTTPGDVYTGKIPIMGPEGGPNPDLTRRAYETATLFSPPAASIRAGEQVIPGVATNLTQPRIAPPSATSLQEAGNLGYTALRETGPDVLSSTIADIARSTMQSMRGTIAPQSAPKTYGQLEGLTDPVRSFTSMTDLLATRDALNKIVGSDAGPDGLAARQAMRAVDDLLSKLGPANTRAQAGVAAPLAPEDVAKTLANARANYGAAMRSNQLTGELDQATTGLLERAEGQAGSTYSGANLDNALRAKARAMLERNKQIGGYSPEEVAALENIRDGSLPRNAARRLGNLLGGGGGLGSLAAMAFGHGAGEVLSPGGGGWVGTVVAPAAGVAARGAANQLARRSVNLADELVRSRSPLFSEMLQNAPADVVPGLTRDQTIARALLLPGLLK